MNAGADAAAPTRIKLPGRDASLAAASRQSWFWPIVSLFFVGQLMLRQSVLDWPPDPEHAAGMWSQAICLADGKLSLLPAGAISAGDSWGRAPCLLAPMLAILLRLLPSPSSVFTVARLAQWGLSSVVLGVVFRHVAARGGPVLGAMAALAAATVPIYSAEVEMLGPEIVLSAVLVAGVMAAARERMLQAAGWSVIAFLLVPVGAVLPLAIGGQHLVFAANSRGIDRRDAGRRGAAYLGLFVLFAWLMVLERGPISDSAGKADGAAMLLAQPELIVSGIASLLCHGSLFLSGSSSIEAADESRIALERNAILAVGNTTAFAAMLGTAALGWPVSSLAGIVPVLFLVLGTALGESAGLRLLGNVFLGMMIGANLLDQHGAWSARLAPKSGGTFSVAGNLSYRDRVRQARSVGDAIDQQSGEEPVLANGAFAVLLSDSRLGYVRRRLVPAASRASLPNAGLMDLVRDQPASVVVVLDRDGKDRPFPEAVLRPPDRDDQPLTNGSIDQRPIVFRHFFPKRALESERWKDYVDFLFWNAREADPAARLAVVGERELARGLIGASLGIDPKGELVAKDLGRRLSAWLAELNEPAKAGLSVDAAAVRPRIEEILRDLGRSSPGPSQPMPSGPAKSSAAYFPGKAREAAPQKTK